MSGIINKTEIKNQDMLALKGYITAQDNQQYNRLAEGTVSIDCTHSNLIQRHIELRFDKHENIEMLRHRIYRQTGTPPDFQELQVKSCGQIIGTIPAGQHDDKMIGYFGIESGMEVHCIDLNPYSNSAGGGYEDVSKVKKYRMSDEEYEKRKGTLRDWAKEQKALDPKFNLEKHAKEHQEMVEAMKCQKRGLPLPANFEVIAGKVIRTADKENEGPPPGEESVVGITVGSRCEVQPGNRRGVIMYVGEVEELSGGGHWVGIKFDEPVGKMNGRIKTKVYFDVGDNYGGMVRGKNVACGDFPEADLFDEDSSEEEEEEL